MTGSIGAPGLPCTACGILNPPGMRFCGQCGGSLGQVCAACASVNPPGFRFCGQCSNPLETLSSPAPAIAPPQVVEQAERRQITVMFCDLVDSAEISDQLDPEELRSLLLSYQGAAAAAVERHQGTIAQYLGDGLLIYFGYPSAQEDDAQRAVKAGLDILDSLRRLNDQYRSRQIVVQARIGIHTGLGVAGDVGGGNSKREQLVVGKTPNVAARLQNLADKNTILISGSTWKLVAAYIECESLGLIRLKGLGDQVEAYKVLRTKNVQGRFHASLHHGLVPLCGRQKELQLLTDLFSLSLSGQGQTLLVRADPGIGKSRFVHEFQSQLQGRAQLISAACTAYGESSSLLPIVDSLRRYLSIEQGDSDDNTRHRIEQFLSRVGESTSENISLLCGLLSIPSGQPPLALPPPRQRELTIRLLVRLLVQAADKRPIVLLVEDLHWVDPSTLDFLTELIDAGCQTRLLLLLTTRPQFNPSWNFRPYLTTLDLKRLETEEIERVASAVAGKPIPAMVMQQLVDRSDGVPLYVEELTRATLESGVLREMPGEWKLVTALDANTIPSSLRDSLMGRLDRLGPAKDVAQIASVIGRSFTYKLMAAISRQPTLLRRQLDQLQDADIIQIEEVDAFAEVFRFKHALIQDTAYESMLRSRRREIHESLARTLEADFPEIVQTRPGLLALHYLEAGFVETSVGYRLKAGHGLMQDGAFSEAIAELNQGIDGLQALPPSAPNHSQEAALRAALGGCLIATRGYCAPEVEENVLRSRELCTLLQNPTSQLIQTLYGLWVVNLASSRVEPTIEYARELVAFSSADQDPFLKVTIHFANGTTLLYLGKFAEARREFEAVLHVYEPSMHARLVATHGDDHGLFASIYLQWLEVLTGNVDRALKLLHRNLEMAEILDNSLSKALALTFAMIAHHDFRQPLKAQAFAQRSSTLCEEQGFAFWGSLAQIGLGWAQSTHTADHTSLSMITKGLGFFDLIQQKLPLAYWKSYLAEAHLQAGSLADGLQVVDEALALSSANLDRMYHPELLRLKGDLLQLQNSESDACLALYREALSTARDSGALLLELRAVVSLVKRLERSSSEAREQLAATLAKMPQGLDLDDYREAVALQAEIG